MPDELSSASVTQTKSDFVQHHVPLIACADIERFLKNHDASLIKEYLVTNGNSSRDSFAMTLTDSSMEPYFPQGAILILNAKKRHQTGAMC